LRKHFWNAFLLSLSLIAGGFLFGWGLQQFDVMASQLIANYAMDWIWWFPGKGWFGIGMPLHDAYVYFFYMAGLGYLVSLIGVFISLWWWSDE